MGLSDARRNSSWQLATEKDFFSADIPTIANEYRTSVPETFQQEGFENALELFRETAQRVPAYQDFLNKRNIQVKSIATYEDFQCIPTTNKNNYLRAYPLKDLCWDGSFQGYSLFYASSGSTGEPFIWPLGEAQKTEGAWTFELFLREVFEVHKRSTLYIDCFAMGTWIAGTFTMECIEQLSRKGYPIVTITPGLEKNSIYTLFQKLAPAFDQIIFGAYPPYMKDILDEGIARGIDWKRHRIKFLFGAEGFSERWREHVHRLVGAEDALLTSINIYGSTDACNLAHETPLTTAIRRAIGDSSELTEQLFGKQHLPTLTQYDPRLKFFEVIDRSLIFTTRAGIPLIRYHIGDEGDVLAFNEMGRRLAEVDIDMAHLLDQQGHEQYYWKLPFVYLFGRSDLTISFYGVLIYPEHVKFGLERTSVQKCITGKFMMAVERDADENPYILLDVELAPGVQPASSIEHEIQQAILAGLRKVNSEFSRLETAIKERALPRVVLVAHSSTEYFRPGRKLKWVKL